jgi:tRNA(adenine34) deaminase
MEDLEKDKRFMREALREAEMAYREGEVPVGAVVVYKGRIIGRGHNRTEALQDPTAHAEIIAITAASNFLKNWRLKDCILYVTLEPCIMCTGASILSRIEEIVYALPDPKFGGCISLYKIPEDLRLNHRVRVRRGPYGDRVERMMRSFFEERRGEET